MDFGKQSMKGNQCKANAISYWHNFKLLSKTGNASEQRLQYLRKLALSTSVIRSCKGNRDSSMYFPFTLGLPLNFSRRSQKDLLNRRKIQSEITRKFTSGKVLCKSSTAGSSHILRLKIARSEHLNCPWGNIDIQQLFPPTNELFVWTPILHRISVFKWYSLHLGFSIEVLPLNIPFPCFLQPLFQSKSKCEMPCYGN